MKSTRGKVRLFQRYDEGRESDEVDGGRVMEKEEGGSCDVGRRWGSFFFSLRPRLSLFVFFFRLLPT